MTREEAIIELKLFKESAKEWNVPELVDALDMAIEALQDKEDEPQFYTEDDYWNGTFAESAEAYKAWTGEEMGGTSNIISRADAIAYIDRIINSGLGRNKSLDYIHKYISSLPPAEAEQTVVRSRTLMPTKDFKEWAKRVREENPNAIIIPCDAEVVSAESEQIVYCMDTESAEAYKAWTGGRNGQDE